MQIKRRDPNKPFRIRIMRTTIEQLDQAIEDLKKRGFVLINRGFTENEIVCYSGTNKRNSKYEFLGTTKIGRAWAIVEKKNK